MERDQRLFVEGTRARVEQLISRQVWAGLDLARCRSWFQQFAARDCELLGACLLDQLTYRSKVQVEALLKSVLSSPEMIGDSAEHDFALIDSLRDRWKDPGIRLSPVIRLDQSPTKSGTYMLRLLARSLRLQERWMVWPQALTKAPPSVHTVVLVDDFCGSGSQFSEFVSLTELNAFMASRADCRIVYVTAAAHADGIARIHEEFPQIEVLSGELLDSKNHFFEGDALRHVRTDGIPALLRQQYDQIAGEVKLGGRVGPLGFDQQALTYAFAHGTPNNSLPIYWYRNDRWDPLVDR